MEFHIENTYTWPAGRCTPRTTCCSSLLLGDSGLQWRRHVELQRFLQDGYGLPPFVVYPDLGETAVCLVYAKPRRYRQGQQW